MQPPDEKPIVFDVADDAKPATSKGARPSTVVQILHPLAGPAEPAKPERPSETDVPPALVEMLPGNARGHSITRRLLVAAVTLSVIAITFVSGIYFGRYWPSARPVGNLADDVADTTDSKVDRQPEASLTDPDQNYQSDLVPDEDSTSASDELTPVRRVARRRYTKPRRTFAAYRRPRRPLGSNFWMSDFTPTTLIIYVENGEIKTRIEPHVTAGYKKQPGISN